MSFPNTVFWRPSRRYAIVLEVTPNKRFPYALGAIDFAEKAFSVIRLQNVEYHNLAFVRNYLDKLVALREDSSLYGDIGLPKTAPPVNMPRFAIWSRDETYIIQVFKRNSLVRTVLSAEAGPLRTEFSSHPVQVEYDTHKDSGPSISAIIRSYGRQAKRLRRPTLYRKLVSLGTGVLSVHWTTPADLSYTLYPEKNFDEFEERFDHFTVLSLEVKLYRPSKDGVMRLALQSPVPPWLGCYMDVSGD